MVENTSFGGKQMTEKFEVTIVLDENLKAIVSIPSKMTAIEFKGLMMKTTKLFNISQSEMLLKESSPRRKRGRNGYTPEMDKEIVKLKDKTNLSWQKIADKLNKSYGQQKVEQTYRNRYDIIKAGDVER